MRCSFPAGRALVDAHFSGTISPARERDLRQHLPDCPECRGYYDRHLLLASLDPRAPGARERLAAGLGVDVSRRRATLTHCVVAVGALAALFLAIAPLRTMRSDDFAARGPAVATSEPKLLVYRLGQQPLPQSLGTTMRATDELAFAYSNPGGYKKLMIFGVDEHRHVYWYHPEWSDAAADPHAIEISADTAVHEIPAAITHALDGTELQIFAVFTNEDLSVRGVEQLIEQSKSPADALPLKKGVVKKFTLRVER